MTEVVKVSCHPNDGTPQVIAGSPVDGDLVRITTNSGAVIYERYTAPTGAAPPPQFKTISGAKFIEVCVTAIGFARVDQLLSKSAAVSALIQKADKVDRLKGNTPAAIAYLKTGANALNDAELALIDAVWAAL